MVNHDSHDAWSRSDDTPATLPFWCLLYVTVACGLVGSATPPVRWCPIPAVTAATPSTSGHDNPAGGPGGHLRGEPPAPDAATVTTGARRRSAQ